MPHRQGPKLNCVHRLRSVGGRATRGHQVIGPFAQDRPAERVTLEVTTLGPQRGIAIVGVAGEIDLRTAEHLREGLLDVAAAGHRCVIVTFDRVGFCDATGLGALVAARKRLTQAHGLLLLAGVRPAQRRLFEITGLDRRFPMFDSTEAAVAGAQEQLGVAKG